MANRVRLGQIFNITDGKDGDFIPTKASLYLKRIGENARDYFYIEDDPVVIDATNFSAIYQGVSKIIFDECYEDFTGNGYMRCLELADPYSGFSILQYPIKVESAALYHLWLRVYSTNVTDIDTINIYLDNDNIQKIDISSTTEEWHWVHTTIVIHDNLEHVLGISLEEENFSLDKIYINVNNVVQSGNGADYTESPFLTTHVKIHELDTSINMLNPLFVYDYKNSIDEIKRDDWYNYDTTVLLDSVSFDFVYYAIVFTVTGGDEQNSITWELQDSSSLYDPYDPYDPYDVSFAISPSIIKVG